MKATYIDLKDTKDYSCLKQIGQAIQKGSLVVFPTETVYGIGTNGLDTSFCSRIYQTKGRAPDNPLILHISNLAMLDTIAKDSTPTEKLLIDAFFPGPFTLILTKKDIVPSIVTAGLDTVAVRMPSDPIANALITYAGVPIAAPSANISGRPSGTNIKDISEELEDNVDYIIDGGNSTIGLESTVVRVIDNIPTILRPGKITKEQILAVAGSVSIDKHLFVDCNPDEKVLSPGMKHKHYAPNTNCIMIYSQDTNRLVHKMNEIAAQYLHVLIISTTENITKYHADYVLDIGSQQNLEYISKNIFSTLRKVDTYPVNLVLIEGIAKEGLGLAIMNRLIRACAYQYIEC